MKGKSINDVLVLLLIVVVLGLIYLINVDTIATDKEDPTIEEVDKSNLDMYIYYQTSADKTHIRFVCGFSGVDVKKIEELSIDYNLTENESTLNDTTLSKTTKTVYTSIMVNDMLLTAEELGFEYIAPFLISTPPVGKYYTCKFSIAFIDGARSSVTRTGYINQ